MFQKVQICNAIVPWSIIFEVLKKTCRWIQLGIRAWLRIESISTIHKMINRWLISRIDCRWCVQKVNEVGPSRNNVEKKTDTNIFRTLRHVLTRLYYWDGSNSWRVRVLARSVYLSRETARPEVCLLKARTPLPYLTLMSTKSRSALKRTPLLSSVVWQRLTHLYFG